MASTFSFVVVFGCLGFCSANVERRLDFLEMQVNREAFKTKSDILELRELISSMNRTGSSDCGKVGDTSAVDMKLDELMEKLTHFMHHQHKRNAALAKAISDEKSVSRKLLKIVRELTDSNTESVLEIEQVLEQSKIERDKFKNEWEMFEENVKSELNDMANKSQILHEKFKNFDGNIIIHNFEKKEACPKTWKRDKDTCYLYQKEEKLNWYGARIRCDDLGGKLAEPDTEEKMLYVLSTVDKENIWIGATDDEQEGKWVWASTQEQVKPYMLWQPNQPNNLFGNQHCMEIGLLSVNDESCMEENYYVCEKPVVE